MAISSENYWTAVAGDSKVYLLDMRDANFRPVRTTSVLRCTGPALLTLCAAGRVSDCVLVGVVGR